MLGLVREVVAASYFGVTGAMSAFTIAFQVPNLVRALFADSALQGAFVPVFTELLEKGERREAFRVASSLFFLIALVLGAVTAAFILLAEPIMSVFAPGFDDDPALQRPDGHARPAAVPDRPAAGPVRASWSGCSTPSSTSACRRSRRWRGTW